MLNHPLQPVPASGPPGGDLDVTLIPLQTLGQAALAPDLAVGVRNIALSGLGVLWHNAFNEITFRKADDLFACAAADGAYYDPIPKGAELIQATLDVQFVDAAEPHTVDLIPPHTLTLQNPADAARILPLLARRGFRAAKNLLLALVLAAACAPDTSFADTDDGDEREFLVFNS